MSGIASLENDPFAAIRRLNFLNFEDDWYDISQAANDAYTPERRTQWRPADDFYNSSEFAPFRRGNSMPVALDAQGNELTGVYSPEDAAMLRMQYQDPTGSSSRDVMNAIYRRGADGQWELDPAVHQFRNQSTWTGFRDAGMPIAATAAAIMGAPYLSAMYGGLGLGTAASAAATGATIGGGGAALGGGNRGDILRGALIGGIGGYAGSELGNFLEYQDFMATQDALQAAGSAGGAGSAAGSASGAGSAAGMGNTVGLSGAGQTINITGAAGSAPLHSLGSVGTGLGGFAGAVPSAVNPQGPVETTQLDPNRQQIDVVGDRGSVGPSLGETMAGIPGAVYGSANALNPGETGRIEVIGPRANNQVETPDEFRNPLPMMPGGIMGPMPPQSTTPRGSESSDFMEVNDPPGRGEPEKGNPFLEWAKKNPVQAIKMLGVLGGALGGSKGGGSGGAGGSLPSQAGITANQPAAFQRQYVAPPPGYRPGFDPEHTFFTGIGSVGVGG